MARNTFPTLVLTLTDVESIGAAHDAFMAAAVLELGYSDVAYQATRDGLVRVLRRLCGIQAKTYYAVSEALFDNAPVDATGVVASLTLTGHNVVVDGAWIPSGSEHYTIRRALAV